MIDVEYGETFIKDLKKLKSTPYYQKIYALCFSEIPAIKSFPEIVGLKKMEGYIDYYRIKKGDYRIGIRITSHKIYFLRILHRKEIYRYFPPK